MSSFRYKRNLGGDCSDHPRKDMQLAASQTVLKGNALVRENGELRVATASDTSKIDCVAAEDMTSSTTDIKKPKVIAATGTVNVFENDIDPLLDEVVATGGSTTTAAVPTSGLSSNDLRYGLMYCKELNEQRVISASTATSSGSSTLTTVEPFSRAIAAGDTISAIPFGVGADPKLADKDSVSCAVADKTGGPVIVEKVDLKRQMVEVISK